jgi:hypothetical protein
MNKQILSLIVPALILALTMSAIAVLPVSSQDTDRIVNKLKELDNKLEGEKPALQNKVNAVIHQIESGAFNGAINKLQNDVKKSIIAWVENPEELIKLVDEIIDLIKGITPPPNPDFEMTTPPYRLDVLQGGFNTTIITITSVNNFSAEVALSAITSAPEVTITLEHTTLPIPANATATSELMVNATQTAAPGDYMINVTGTSGTLKHNVEIPLRIIEVTPPTPDFTITASPDTLSIEQGHSNTSVITVTSVNGFDKQVDLAVSSASIPGVSATLNPNNVSLEAKPYDFSILTLDISSDAVIGSYTISVTGTNGSLQHTANITLTVTAPPVPPEPDFSINASPTTLTIEQGDTADSTIIVTSLRDFNAAVDLTLTPESIAGVTLSLDSTQITPSPNDFATSTLRIEITADASPNEHSITITGTSGALQRSVTISLIITIETKPPVIVSVSQIPANAPAYNETVTILANIVDTESGVKNATLRYSIGAVQQDIIMTLIASVYEAVIPAYPYGTVIEYSVRSSDNAGNSASSNSATYTVADPYQPLIGLPTWTPQDPIVNEDIIVNVTVMEPEDASGVDLVILSYSNTTSATNVYSILMTDNHDGNWTAVISNQTGAKVTFVIKAVDKAGNEIESDTHEINVTTPAFPLVWILAAIAILAAATGGGAYYVRRKKKKGAAAPPVPSATIKPIS